MADEPLGEATEEEGGLPGLGVHPHDWMLGLVDLRDEGLQVCQLLGAQLALWASFVLLMVVNTVPMLIAMQIVFGLATVVFGLSRSFWLSLAALTVVGASDMVSVVVRSTLVQLRTPHACAAG